MEPEKRVYQIIHNDGHAELIIGYKNLPLQETVKNVRRIRYPKQNVAFFDAEYTCPILKGARPAELLSVGIIICDRKFQVLDKYYSNVCPEFESTLTDYCKNLTGLQQTEIDSAPSYEVVMKRIIRLLNDYDVRSVLVWGSDKAVLQKDLEKNHPNIPLELKASCEDMISKVVDVGERISSFVWKNTLSLATMKYICGGEKRVTHNALEDAEVLQAVVSSMMEGQWSELHIREVRKYLRAKERYQNFRRFYEKAIRDKEISNFEINNFDSSVIDLGEKYVLELNRYMTPEIMAIRDDILVLQGGAAFGFPELEEYIKIQES